MTEHEPHEAKAEEVERELDAMDEQRERLGGEIEGASEEWERRKKDERVPGAGGMPEQADGPEPEAQYPSKAQSAEDGDDDSGDVSDEDLDFGKDIDSEDVVPEASSADDSDEDDPDEDDSDDDASEDR